MPRGKQRIQEDSTWVIRSGEEPSAPIDRHLDALWKRGHDALTRLSTTPSLSAQCLLRVVQYLDASEYQGHGLNLSADWVRLLAAVGAQIDIDQYIE